ncbi:MAG: AraC family transcriptional regulator [Pseudomonadota bacterium]
MREELEPYVRGDLRYLSNSSGSIFLVRSSFLPFEGEMLPDRYTKIGLNIGTTSKLYRRSDIGCLDSDWRRNGITINLANDAGYGCSGAATMIGIAVDFDAFQKPEGYNRVQSALESLATRVTVDTVSARLLRSMFVEADMHGCSDAFFDATVDTLLRRLSVDLTHSDEHSLPPLEERQFGTVRDFIEESLATKLSVRDMAACLNMEHSRFAKRFASSTGLAPFGYLTMRRMEHAKLILSPDLRIIDVAQAVGYDNPSKFAAAFRRYTGLSPRDWIRKGLGT